MVLAAFTNGADLEVADIQDNLEEARTRLVALTAYGEGTRPQPGYIGRSRGQSDLASAHSFRWIQNGLASLNGAGLGGQLSCGSSVSFALGDPPLTLTCITDPAALGEDPAISWTFSGTGTAGLWVRGQGLATSTAGSPNKLINGFTYQLELTSAGSPGVASWLSFGLMVMRYPQRHGGL